MLAAARAWWTPVLAAIVVLAASFAQPSCVGARDIRLEAMRSLVDLNRTYMGDPEPSIRAAARLARDPRAPIYDAEMRVGSAFIYPPIAALPYAPLARVAPNVAHARLAAVSHVLFVIVALLVWRLAARRADAIDVAAVAAGCVVFYPLVHAVELNQATLAVTALVGAAWVLIERPALAGIAFALAIAIKPHLALALPLLWWHARRMVVAALASGVVLVVASIAYAGIANHVAYATRVAPILSHGYAYYANQAPNGFFYRLLVDDDIGVFRRAPESRAVAALTAIASIAILAAAFAIARRARKAPSAAPWVFAIAWLAATLASPVAWQHHFAPSLFVFALLWRTLREGTRDRWIVAGAAGAFALVASYFEVRQLRGVASRALASYVLAGALVLFATLARATRLAAAQSAKSASGHGPPARGDAAHELPPADGGAATQ